MQDQDSGPKKQEQRGEVIALKKMNAGNRRDEVEQNDCRD